MALTLDWQADGQQATIRQGGVMIARLLGLPFLAASGYLWYQFAGGLIHDELTWAGWTLLPLLAIAALVPGWILVVGRRRTRLDNARREIIQEFDFLVYQRRMVAPLTHDSHVRLRYERGGSNDHGTLYDIHADVVTPGQSDAMIGLFSDRQRSEALTFGAKAAAFLAIPLKDQMVEGGDVTSGGVVVEKLDPEDAD